ncbi:hypothetical protein [Schleiferilactobacillus perolens]|uniref:hypothetical protein n=1 Tax=Schleiferilactobacillus perolens TaxID=100468 RepID=UPI0039E8E856
MKEEMLWQGRPYASNYITIFQFAKIRWIFLVCGALPGLLLFSAAREWYGSTTTFVVLTYLLLAGVVCIIGPSVAVARINQALQLLSIAITTGVLGGLVVSAIIVVGPFLVKPIPLWLFASSFFIWPITATAVFEIMYTKTLRGDFMKRASAKKTKAVVKFERIFTGALGLSIAGIPLFNHFAEKTQFGKNAIWLMGIIGGIGFAGMSGGLMLIVIAKAKFPAFNAKIPSRLELRRMRQESAATATLLKQRKKDGVFFQVNDVNPNEGGNPFKTSQNDVSKWFKNERK